MGVIRNKMNQKLIINLKDGKKIELLAKESMNVSEYNILTSHFQSLIANGSIATETGETETQVIKKGKSKKNSKGG